MLTLASLPLRVATLGSERILTLPFAAAAVNVADNRKLLVTRPQDRAPKTLSAASETPVPAPAAPIGIKGVVIAPLSSGVTEPAGMVGLPPTKFVPCWPNIWEFSRLK